MKNVFSSTECSFCSNSNVSVRSLTACLWTGLVPFRSAALLSRRRRRRASCVVRRLCVFSLFPSLFLSLSLSLSPFLLFIICRSSRSKCCGDTKCDPIATQRKYKSHFTRTGIWRPNDRWEGLGPTGPSQERREREESRFRVVFFEKIRKTQCEIRRHSNVLSGTNANMSMIRVRGIDFAW